MCFDYLWIRHLGTSWHTTDFQIRIAVIWALLSRVAVLPVYWCVFCWLTGESRYEVTPTTRKQVDRIVSSWLAGALVTCLVFKLYEPR